MKALVAGVMHRKGVSKKGTGSPYDFAVVHILRPVSLRGSQHMTAQGFGMEPAEIRCDPAAVGQFAGLKLPEVYELVIENEVGEFGQLQAVCRGVARQAARAVG